MHGLTVRFTAIVALGFVGALAASGLTACEPVVPDTYVALGDSYAAGPLVPDQTLSPVGCGRSTNNYAHVISSRIHVTKFVDVTCSAATTDSLYVEQNVAGGANPAQADSLDDHTKVVTFQFGGNDIGFGEVVQSCITLLPWGAGCAATKYQVGGQDVLRDRIRAAEPKIARALAEVKRKAPNAKVFVVGYPAILPESGGCWSVTSPIVDADIPYLRGVLKDFNRVIAAQAAAAGAVYLDIYTPTIGHDACSSNRWIEPVIPSTGTPAFPVHPNYWGYWSWGPAMADTINQHVPA